MRAAHFTAMRFVYSTIVFAGLWPAVSQADPGLVESPSRRWHAGVIAGLNLSDSTGRECTASCDELLPGVDLQASFNTGDQVGVGGFLIYGFTPRYALRVEARLNMKGVKAVHGAPAVMFDDQMNPEDVFINYTIQHTLRYVQVPVLLQMEIPYDPDFRPHVLAGVGVGYQWAASGDGEGSAFDAEGNIRASLSGEGALDEAARSLDLSLILGAGTTFPLWGGQLELGVRYEMSMLSAVDGSFETSLESDEPIYFVGTVEPADNLVLRNVDIIAESMRHRVVSVVAGYRF